MQKPRMVRAKIVIEVDADVILDRSGDIEEVQDIHEVLEAIELVSITNVKTTQ